MVYQMEIFSKSKQYSSGKRLSFINWLLVFTVLLLIFNTSEGISQEKDILVIEAIEYPGKYPVMWDELYAASDGKVYSALISEGTSTHFYAYDPLKMMAMSILWPESNQHIGLVSFIYII